MDEPMRRAWSRPELIVLVRRGPEEAVLSACKAFDCIPLDDIVGAAACKTEYSEACPSCYELLVS